MSFKLNHPQLVYDAQIMEVAATSTLQTLQNSSNVIFMRPT